MMIANAKLVYARLLRIPVIGVMARIPVRLYKAVFLETGRRLHARQDALESAVAALRTDVDLLRRSVEQMKSDLEDAHPK